MIEIRLTYTCQRCGGTGVESDPDGFGYADLYERARALNRGGGAGSSIHIYNRLCDERKAELGLETEPPEEDDCRACHGTGTIADTFDEAALVNAIQLVHRQQLGDKAAPVPVAGA